MPGAAEKKWDHAAEMDLLVAMIHGNQESTDRVKHKWDVITTHMTNMGHVFTKDAISQHFTKVIMKDFKKRYGSDVFASSTPKKPMATPKKRTPSKRVKSEKTKDLDNDDNDYDCDMDYDIGTPSKKVKAEKQENPFGVKYEGGGGGGGASRDIRERSATVMNDDDTFEKWVAAKDE